MPRRKLEVMYTLECLPEDVPVRGNAMASGDPSADRRVENWIIKQLEAGNDWAWFTAKVTAEVVVDGETFTGVDYLGSCSYKSERDFRRDPYFADMKAEALARLKDTMEAAVKRGAVAGVWVGALPER